MANAILSQSDILLGLQNKRVVLDNNAKDVNKIEIADNLYEYNFGGCDLGIVTVAGAPIFWM